MDHRQLVHVLLTRTAAVRTILKFHAGDTCGQLIASAAEEVGKTTVARAIITTDDAWMHLSALRYLADLEPADVDQLVAGFVRLRPNNLARVVIKYGRHNLSKQNITLLLRFCSSWDKERFKKEFDLA